MAEFFIGEKRFDSKKNAEEFVRSKLVADFNPGDPLWLDLIKLHSRASEKIGVGVKRFFVTRNSLNKSALQLNIERVDGSVIDISWIKCLSGKPTATKTNLNAAMRRAVSGQVQDFKDNNYFDGIVCLTRGVEIPNRFSAHADHYPISFSSLSKNFLELFPKEAIPVDFDSCPISNAAIFCKSNYGFESAWKIYHASNAVLRILCAKCNTGIHNPQKT